MTTPTLTHRQALIARVMLLDERTLKHCLKGRSLILTEQPLTTLDPGNAAELLIAHDAEISDALSVLDELTEHLVTPYSTIQKNAIAKLRAMLGVEPQ